MKILVATKNPAKSEELRRFLGDNFELVSLSNFEEIPEVAEDGETFEENAIIKARAYFEWSGLPAMADDGGLEIDALGGEPGVKSRRWPGHEASDEELIRLVLERLRGIPWERRTACLRLVGAYCDGKNILTETAAINGIMAEKFSGTYQPGYPFRSLFWISRFGKLFRDLNAAEHAEINHRKIVYEKLKEDVVGLNENR